MVDVRRKVNAIVDSGMNEASVDAVATLTDGRTVHVHVEHAIGSLQRPMPDNDLENKFHGMTDELLGNEQTSHLISKVWKLAAALDVGVVTPLARNKKDNV